MDVAVESVFGSVFDTVDSVVAGSVVVAVESVVVAEVDSVYSELSCPSEVKSGLNVGVVVYSG